VHVRRRRRSGMTREEIERALREALAEFEGQPHTPEMVEELKAAVLAKLPPIKLPEYDVRVLGADPDGKVHLEIDVPRWMAELLAKGEPV
jgi:hypothetical protein